MRVSFFALSGLLLASQSFGAAPLAEHFSYTIEWKLIEAGRAQMISSAAPGSAGHRQVDLKLQSVGLVSRLYKVDDLYRASLDGSNCVSAVFMKSEEGRRQRETRITFDASRRKANYLEQDLVKNSVVLQKEIDVPACVHDVLGALYALRTKNVPLGHFADLPMSDGKKSITIKVEAQEREEVKTPAGKFQAVRYEAFLFNNQLYRRKARVFVWLTDDDRRLPVQFRVRLGLAVGTISVTLTKDELK